MRGERVLRFRISAFRGQREKLTGALEILRKLLALQIEQAEIVGGAGVTELGRGFEQPRGFFQVSGGRAALEIEHRQREQGITVAFGGGHFVPLGCLGIVAAHAETLRVNFAEQRHGSGIILLRALGRLVEGGEIKPALEGAVGEVDIALIRASGRVRCRRRHGAVLRRDLRGRCRNKQRCDDGAENEPDEVASCRGLRHTQEDGTPRLLLP